jgi:outer membrane protease
MAYRHSLFVVASLVLLLALASSVRAQAVVPSAPWFGFPSVTSISDRLLRGQYHQIGVKKFFNSFTSYEFPNPFSPSLDPLSRLEFPIDQFFVGVEAGCVTSMWALRAEVWTNLNSESTLKMQDSDWEDEAQPLQKTIFSESGCRLNRGWLVDVQISSSTVLPMAPGLSPVVGSRYQQFFFTTHDGVQMSLGGPILELPGDGINFRQTFYHLYAGLILEKELNPSPEWLYVPEMKLDLKFDYAVVIAKNEDLHLLRSGERITTENTRGHCWHVALGSECLVRNRFKARLEGDFKRLITHGGHQLTNNAFAVNFSFDGSRVWSDQITVSLLGELIF